MMTTCFGDRRRPSQSKEVHSQPIRDLMSLRGFFCFETSRSIH